MRCVIEPTTCHGVVGAHAALMKAAAVCAAGFIRDASPCSNSRRLSGYVGWRLRKGKPAGRRFYAAVEQRARSVYTLRLRMRIPPDTRYPRAGTSTFDALLTEG